MSDINVSDKTSVGLPLRNLIGLASAVAVGTWAWFGLQERLNVIETNQILMQKSVEQNENFRIKWPRGDLGALPADAEQFMLLEHLAKEFSKLDETEEQFDHIQERIQLWIDSSPNEDTGIPLSWLEHLLSSSPAIVALVDEEGKPDK